jgi:hypothetical protein
LHLYQLLLLFLVLFFISVAVESAEDIIRFFLNMIGENKPAGLSDIRHRPEKNTRGQPVGPCRRYAAVSRDRICDRVRGYKQGAHDDYRTRVGHRGQERVLTTPYGNNNIIAMIYYNVMYIFYGTVRWRPVE